MPNPRFKIKNNFQKKTELYEDILTADILSDVCQRITGKRKYIISCSTLVVLMNEYRHKLNEAGK